MAVIRVTLGGCGIMYTDANGNARHVLKTPQDGPFECDDKHAESLVRMGRAEYVQPQATAVELHCEPSGDSGKLTGHLEVADLELMDYNDLKKLAADMGVKPEGQKKADYIAAIVAVEVEVDEEDPDDELPDLSAADPE